MSGSLVWGTVLQLALFLKVAHCSLSLATTIENITKANFNYHLPVFSHFGARETGSLPFLQPGAEVHFADSS